jgi:hypothetical protein
LTLEMPQLSVKSQRYVTVRLLGIYSTKYLIIYPKFLTCQNTVIGESDATGLCTKYYGFKTSSPCQPSKQASKRPRTYS